MSPMRILHVIPTLDQSGAEKQLCLLAANLPRDQFHVTVCCITRGGHYEEALRQAGIDVVVLGKRFKLDPLAWRRLYRLMQRLKPDIVQTWLFAGNVYGRAAARWAGVKRIIASERCVDSWKQESQFVLDRWMARWTEAVVVNASAVARFYERRGIDRQKLHVIPNAIEPKRTDLPARDDKLASLGLPTDRSTVGFVGRLWPQKRVHDLIWAADVLRISGWKLNVLIAGDGPRRGPLERFMRSLELEDTVQFLGHRADVDELLEAIDIFVLPSKFEGMSNVTLEAMRAGKPVVATRIAGMDEVVVDGSTGLLVPPKQPFELAKAIHALLGDPVKAKAMGEAGRRRVLQNFTIDRMVEAYARLYEGSDDASAARSA